MTATFVTTAPPASAPVQNGNNLKAKASSANTGYITRAGVADNYMYELKASTDLPTTDALGGHAFDKSVDAVAVAQEWLDKFAAAAESHDGKQFAGCFSDFGVWRDKVIFTFEYRTFNGLAKIEQAATDLLSIIKPHSFHLITPQAKVDLPYPDLTYVQAHIGFSTAIATGSAVVNLVPTKDGVKAWTIHTAIESLIEFPELPNRDGHMTGPHAWAVQRAMDTNFDNSDPEVLVIGGGHNGLMCAARLQALGVKALIVERNARIGDNWRLRYEALSLHFPHWGDHLPYMNYPGHWPIYTPAAKLGNWLEAYADAMELHAWLSSNVTKAEQNEATGEWTVTVNRGGQGERVLKPKHVIMATSLAGVPFMPHTPGEETYTGTLRHSTAHDSSREWVGKKVLVVGTSSSGFDTAYDFARRGIDVTILQRSPTYIMSLTNSVPMMLANYAPGTECPSIEVADRLGHSMPVAPGESMARRMIQDLASQDTALLEGMEAAGFKCYLGQRGTGTITLGYTKNGGFYFDAGACEKIMDGSIKVEQGYIERFDKEKVILNGGREKEYDLVVMATGFSNTIDSVRRTLGDDIADRTGDIWGIDEEGELKGTWRNSGVKGLWIMVGTLMHGRYHSQKVALRIKAMLEGIAPESYTA
ncbi:flavin-containing monooxygenase [Pseudohyphozyma bogoriensis]|nr:flavin-containing monooxygenase [Pseudohyphozyma bogoriensis]